MTKEEELSYYTIFRVNNKTFTNYDTAKAYRQIVKGQVAFEGYHKTKGWVGFYYRLTDIVVKSAKKW